MPAEQRNNLTLTPQEIKTVLDELDEEYKADPWAWFINEVNTTDEATQQKLRWPDKEYLRDLVDLMQTERLVAIPKSRRLMISWFVSAWAVFKARYFPYHAVFIQSETEQKASFLTDKRCVMIEGSLTEPLLRRTFKPIRTHLGAIGRITYDRTGSYIWAIPQGDSVIRSYTFSNLFMDESDFQPEGIAALEAALSIAESDKSSQIVLITTSNGPSGAVAEICKGVGFLRWSG